MRSLLFALATTAALGMLMTVPVSGRPRPIAVWFAPSPGSLDYQRLFEAPDEWPAARKRVAVMKFYQQHLLRPAPQNVGPNSYDALRAVDAFRIISTVWHKRLAIEVGSVKPHYCKDGASDAAAAVRDSLAAIAAVRDAGGEVNYLAMDEPFLAGRSAACGGPDPGPTLDALERYIGGLRQSTPSVAVGLIEPYPFFTSIRLQEFLTAMSLRGVKPAFFHLDIDLDAIKPASDSLTQDLVALAARCTAERIPFGIIVWGGNGDSDALYVEDAMRIVRRIDEAFPDRLPPQIVFQSWAVSRTGRSMTPTNLPEGGENTHTSLVLTGMRLLTRPGDEDSGGRARGTKER